MENSKNVLDIIFEETGVKYDNVSYINWSKISINQKLSEKFMREFKYKIVWNCISKYQKLSEDFIREFKNKVSWGFISKHQKLSENFIREFKDKVDWAYISKYQKLSENFILEFKNEISWWGYISKYQKLSESFISENINKISLPEIVQYQKLSDELFKKIDGEKDRNNWLYKDAEFKKKQVIETGLYECYDDYFITYKAIRSDRYSHFNFQYQYLKGGVYECHCDCTMEENSFGLSAWTKVNAFDYNSTGLIVKVKIKYEDVGKVVHNGGKIRCFKFEVLD